MVQPGFWERNSYAGLGQKDLKADTISAVCKQLGVDRNSLVEGVSKG